MLIQIQEVTKNNVKNGKGGYWIAEVTYTSNGKNSNKKIFSFANPTVYDVVSNAVSGSFYEVEVKKNGEYWDWVAIKPAGDGQAAPQNKAAVGSGKVLGSTYETAEERAKRQLMIVRQSSISNAVETLSPGSKTALDPDAVLAVAQKYVDFVYGNEDLFEQPNDLGE